MLPVIAIVGRPNVGKSTLFNQLTRSRHALVVDTPGVTRDRLYGEADYGGRRFIVIDTGGISDQPDDNIWGLTADQAWQAIHEADKVLFLVDGQVEPNNEDLAVAEKLRKLNKPMELIVNKTDGADPDVLKSNFYSMGLGEPLPISAKHKRGLKQMVATLFDDIPEIEEDEEEKQKAEQGIKIAVVGRPNVGKSTLVNRMVGEERVISLDRPGTTRDSIYVPFTRRGKSYTLIDTAGVRKKNKVKETIEKFSVVKALQAIEAADVVIMVCDAQQGIHEQDISLLGFVLDAGRACVLAVNKCDNLEGGDKDTVLDQVKHRLKFANFVKPHFISALEGTRVGDLFASIEHAYRSAGADIPTPKMTKLLEQAVSAHEPPLVGGRRIKPRYAHIGGHYPPIVVVHGNQVERLPQTYQRYLMSYFRKNLKLEGTPIRLELKTTENPYN